MAKMGELKRAAQMLGVTSTTLRQYGWKTASAARVQAVTDDPPDWLIAAGENRCKKRARQRRRREQQSTARRVGIAVRAGKERHIKPADVVGLRAEREAKDELCRQLTDALITSVDEVWFPELQRATTDNEVEAIDARWAPEVGRAKREVRRLVDELWPEQVRARIDREREAAHAAGVYRATQLVRRALGSADG
jgi:2-hydroxychromene-2-carboxylate isomerase